MVSVNQCTHKTQKMEGDFGIPLSQLLASHGHERTYKIPTFQRPYKWGAGRVVTMCKMIWRESQAEPSAALFLGAIITADMSRTRSVFDVVDGQQRLTSYVLLAAAARRKYEALSPSAGDTAALRLLRDYQRAGDQFFPTELWRGAASFRMVNARPDRQKQWELLFDKESGYEPVAPLEDPRPSVDVVGQYAVNYQALYSELDETLGKLPDIVEQR